jgi:hypothetical protein
LRAVEEIFGDAKSVAIEARTFGEKDRLKTSEVDEMDKVEAREIRKRETKRGCARCKFFQRALLIRSLLLKRNLADPEIQERDGVDGPMFAEADAEGDGYVSPKFDLASAAWSESEHDGAPP